ncbi:hypothetical protein L1987_71064 [Smallanthus sonchifolius]|uniref:Uncharacterized protein n=1 Tax=Smallanthus sonchifolius TaxID=185202 RepID=A0ACB9AQL6_9ASTR|nr:hypothetical protein L1987_71064 [Smallanthus sonchifolius]
MENSSILSYEKLEGLANWVGSNVASAFFASLDRFSCVNINTSDSDDENENEEAKDRPLMLTNLPASDHSAHKPTSADAPAEKHLQDLNVSCCEKGDYFLMVASSPKLCLNLRVGTRNFKDVTCKTTEAATADPETRNPCFFPHVFKMNEQKVERAVTVCRMFMRSIARTDLILFFPSVDPLTKDFLSTG